MIENLNERSQVVVGPNVPYATATIFDRNSSDAYTAGFATADLPLVRMEKLTALFSHRAASDTSAIPLLAELLSIPDAPQAPTSLTPGQRNARPRR
jgi:hypothetical protein